MGTSISSKNLGAVIKTLYPYAYATYRNTIFHVTGIQDPPGIISDTDATRDIMKEFIQQPELLKKAYSKLRDELISLGQTPPAIYKEGVTDLNVIVPQGIELRLDDSLDVVYCSRCYQLNRLSKLPRNSKGGMPFHRTCPKGGGYYKQAPVFVPRPPDNTAINISGRPDHGKIAKLSSRQTMCPCLGPDGTCNHPEGDGQCVPNFEGRVGYLKINPDRPIAGLRIFNENCPKGLSNIPEQKLWAPHLGGGHYYSKQFPGPNLSSPLFTTVARAADTKDDEIKEANDRMKDSGKMIFNPDYIDLDHTNFSRINVIEMNYGVRIGGWKDSGYVMSWAKGKNPKVIGRMIDTQGFVITVKPEIYEKIIVLLKDKKYQDVVSKFETDDERQHFLLDILIHTLKHAMLSLVPRETGFEDQMFMGSYEILDEKKGARIYLFDNENGGHGGFYTLIRDKKKFTDMVKEISRRTLHCPIRNCSYGCRNCIFLRRCGRTNRDLNRHLLIDSGLLLPQM